VAEDPDRGALVAVSIGSERSVLAVTDGLTCEFARVLEWGGNHLTGAVGRALELEFDAAERLKFALGVEGEAVPEGLTLEQAGKAREGLGLALQAFGRELVSSLQFYQGQPNSRGIRELLIAGGTAQLDGLATELQRLVGVPVRVGDPLRSIGVAKKLKGAPNPSHAVPIGLAMGV
jgi:type IV pilus assembly protein PilM